MSESRKKGQVVQGTIRIHPRGFGFVQVDRGVSKDIFIPKNATALAVDGDVVEVLVHPEISPKGPEGKVLAILERSRTHVAGIVYEVEFTGEGLAYVPMLGDQETVMVKNAMQEGIKEGDRVVLQVTRWGDKETSTETIVSHKIGSIFDPSVDIECAVEEYSLAKGFSQEALDEADTFPKKVEVGSDREDLRGLETFTIDPETAKDFDDALSLTFDGIYHLKVHIADVSHYVQPGSSLDQEALHRCNSTYFPGRCIPMLPFALSNELCSLKPGVDRLAVTAHISLDKEGNLLDYKFSRSVIHSDQRFTYEEAKDILDGKKTSVHAPTLKKMQELCLLLKKKRKERGSVEFAVPELVVLVDEKGQPTGLKYVDYDITHQLVEEFMLKANELVAAHLDKQKKLTAYRIHEQPDEKNIEEFSRLVNSLGYKMKDKPSPLEIQSFFETNKDSPFYSFLTTHYIRSMKLAVYSPHNIGHYGLSLTHYCHFTSPIRRYADLVVHRILFGDRKELEHLEEITKKASDKERVSAKAEQNVILLKKLRYLVALMEKNPRQTFEAVVTKVKPFGLIFEVIGFEIEGFITLSDIHSDYYEYDGKKEKLVGVNHGECFALGVKLEVYAKAIDLVLLETKWGLCENVKRTKTKKKRKKR